MVNFVLVDDIKWFLDRYERIINKIMIDTNLEYTVYKFFEYDKDFNNFSKKDLENRIYILDVETKNNNGIDVARRLRSFDQKSEIIFSTAYAQKEKHINKFLISSLKAMGMISKDNEKLLVEKIKEIIAYIEQNKNLTMNTPSYRSTINLNEIFYIEVIARITYVHTATATVELTRSLTSIEEELNNKCDFFVRTHRACLVNSIKVLKYDFQNKRIFFKNKLECSLLSRKYKKEIEKIR